MQLLLCTADIGAARTVNNEGKVEGQLSTALNTVTKTLKRFVNVTLLSSDKVGVMNLKTKLFDGCLGQLQNNESDIHTPIVDFPILAPGLKNGYVFLPSKILMISGYSNHANTSVIDVMGAFKSFSRSLWSLIAFTTFIILILLFFTLVLDQRMFAGRKFRRLIRRIRVFMNQTKKVVFANMFKQHSSYDIRLSSTGFVLMIFAVFTVLVICYFSSMIRTEMVIQKRPETIPSYQELLAKPNVMPIWLKSLSDHYEFMNAHPTTPEGRIWARAEEMGISECLMETDLASLNGHSLNISSGQAVWLGARYMLSVFLTNSCARSRPFGQAMDQNAWIRSDERAREKLTSSMVISALPDKMFKHVYKMAQIAFEHNLLKQSIKQLEYAIAKDTGSKELRDCIANTIIYPERCLLS